MLKISRVLTWVVALPMVAVTAVVVLLGPIEVSFVALVAYLAYRVVKLGLLL